MSNKTSLPKLKGADALANEKIPRLIVQFSLTTLIALVFNSLYTLTDALFVSWGVGDNAFGGVSVVLPFTLVQSAISTAIGGGAASLISRLLGNGDKKGAGSVALNAMLTFYISAIVVTVLGLVFMEQIIRAFGVTDELYPYAKKYFLVVLCGNVFSTGFSSIIRAEGKKLYGLLIWVIPISVNIILDAVFIFVCGWGVVGSAAATVICQFTSFSMSVLFFCRFTVLDFKGARPKFKTVGDILGIGLPSLVQMCSLSIMTLLLNNMLKEQSGTLGVNAYSYVSKLITYAIVPIVALTQASAPIIGYNYGAGKPERVKQCVKYSVLFGVLYSAAAILVLELMPDVLLKVFTANKDIIDLGVTAVRILSVSVLLSVAPYIFGAYYQAVGKKLLSLILYASSLIFVVIAVFPMRALLGLDGIWWSYVIGYALSAVLSFVIVGISFKRGKDSSELSQWNYDDFA